MMNFLLETSTGLATESWRLLNEMSPYLLLGFFIAGLLHISIPGEKIYKHLSGNNLPSVIKASIFGIPLPICSCGVIPIAAHLKNSGAGKGSTMSFLISTPTTGIDSILATYSLLGGVFAIVRPLSAFVGGISAGIIMNIFEKGGEKNIPSQFSCAICELTSPHPHTLSEKLKNAFAYAFFDLVRETGKWIIIGVAVGGIIGYFIPAKIITRFLGFPLLAYPLMLIISIPMYVCATGSIPIAASLILKGMSPGAGLIFLMAGPATNTATVSFITGKLGKKFLTIYLLSIIATSTGFGFLVDYLWKGESMIITTVQMEMIPQWLKVICSLVLLALILKPSIKRSSRKKEEAGMKKTFKVPDMHCQHCKNTIEKALKAAKGVEDAEVDLKSKTVKITGSVSDEIIIRTIKEAGYSIEDNSK